MNAEVGAPVEEPCRDCGKPTAMRIRFPDTSEYAVCPPCLTLGYGHPDEATYIRKVEDPAADLVDQMVRALDTLDLALTGKRSPNIRTTPASWTDWFDTELYLSDGGYSRVVCALNDNDKRPVRLFLTSNSRDEVSQAWDGAAAERAAVEQAFGAALEGDHA